MSDKEILVATRYFLRDPAYFCRRQFTDGNGRCCARGALRNIRGGAENYTDNPIIQLLIKHARTIVTRERTRGTKFAYADEFTPGTCPIVIVNDGLGHPFVLEMFDLAIKEIECSHS